MEIDKNMQLMSEVKTMVEQSIFHFLEEHNIDKVSHIFIYRNIVFL